MKTSHLLIGGALLAAGLLYWKSQQQAKASTGTIGASSGSTSTTSKVFTTIARASQLGLDLDAVWS